ncbi:MAG: acyltransferase [Pseudomonadota bacterium]
MKSLNIPYNPRIDQLRWLAATIVFLFHFHLEYRGLGGQGITSNWLGIVTEGHTGVGLFFTLSGFLFMQIALHQQQIVYKDFVRNRFLRIFPLFFTVFLLATSIGRDSFQPTDILYILTTNLGHAPTSGTVITGAAWCISLEFMFYLIFPFLARFAMEQGARYVLKLLALMVFFKVAAFTVNDNSTLMYFCTFVGRFDQFLVGMLAALLYREHRDAIRRAAPMVLPFAFALALANSAMQATLAPFKGVGHEPFWVVWSLLESAVWAAVIVAWVGFERQLPAWLERSLCQGGKVSFSFYLLHMAVLHVLARSVGMLHVSGNAVVDAALMLAGAYGATWTLATLSYNTIEEPFLRMRRGYGSAKAAVLGIKSA